MLCLVLSNFLLALEISPSMSTRPLTCRKTAAAEETEKTTQPAGRESVEERILMVVTPFPESERIEADCSVTVDEAVGVYA